MRHDTGFDISDWVRSIGEFVTFAALVGGAAMCLALLFAAVL